MNDTTITQLSASEFASVDLLRMGTRESMAVAGERVSSGKHRSPDQGVAFLCRAYFCEW
jgi:hypothetical protein